MLDASVRVCIIEATPRGTLTRLDHLLSRKVPTFTGISVVEARLGETRLAEHLDDEDFTDSFSEPIHSSDKFSSHGDFKEDSKIYERLVDRRLKSIRRGENLTADEKVLIVIDQFEQFLNTASVEEKTLLVRALRQCDGHRLQTILLVREDFWIATSRLMEELDIEMSASNNLAMIDLLDKSHAGKLLQMLGTAYGRFGESGSRIRREQRQFIKDAIDDLASGERVVAVHLALFAEMMKSRP